MLKLLYGKPHLTDGILSAGNTVSGQWGRQRNLRDLSLPDVLNSFEASLRIMCQIEAKKKNG